MTKRFLYVHQSSSAHGTTPLPRLIVPRIWDWITWPIKYHQAFSSKKTYISDFKNKNYAKEGGDFTMNPKI
jgi:hypothetical protein